MTNAKTRRKKAPAPAPLILKGELRLNGCTDLKVQLDEALQGAGDAPLQIEAGEVGSVDAAALQLLAVLAQACRRRDLQWQWQGVSDALRQGSRLLGLDDILAMPAMPAK